MLVGVNVRVMCLLFSGFQVLKYNFCSWELRPTYSVASDTLSSMPDRETQREDEKGVTCSLKPRV